MKKSIIAVVLFMSTTVALNAQIKKTKNDAFQRGEKLTYGCYYDALLTGEVRAGVATFEIKKENKKINDRSTYHIEAVGKTKGAFNLFFKVVDRYETFIDEENLAPWVFIRRVDEGGYIINHDVTFNQHKKVAYFSDNKNKRQSTVQTSELVHDILSAIYWCRNLDFETAELNENFYVKFMLDDTIYSSKVTYLGKEIVNTGMGKIRCIKFKPQVLTGTVFKDPWPLTVWVTDDTNKIPVLAESSILVGKVKLELTDYSGLRSPFAAFVKK
jgi:hypothetical protein